MQRQLSTSSSDADDEGLVGCRSPEAAAKQLERILVGMSLGGLRSVTGRLLMV